MLDKHQQEKYLSRIGIDSFSGGLSFLRELHRRHLYSVPFENLSIHHNEKIILSRDWLFEKIVIRKRGGFCYELNGLFYELITSLGYKAKMISARVFNRERIAGPEFDHMAILVQFAGEEYLCDVGFGDLCIEPHKFSLNEIQTDSGFRFKIIKENRKDYKLLRLENSDEWKDQYLFTTQQRELSEFESMCVYHQTSTESHFTQKKVCTIATHGGRITLTNNKLIITESGDRKEIAFEDNSKFNYYLRKYFGIRIA